jgi:HIRAN domain
VRSYPSWIAGLRYRGPDGTKRGKYCLGLREGDRLDLVPEPENEHDRNAIAIKHNGRHLGYVPMRHQWVAEAIAEGDRLSCAVTKMETEGWLLKRASFVGVRIAVEGDGNASARDTERLEPQI